MAGASCLIGLALLVVGEAPDAEVLQSAEQAFAAGLQVRTDSKKAHDLFRHAAAAYEKLAQQGVRNADLYRNLGNAWLLSNELPRAILGYRQGLQLKPDDRGLQANLAYAREQVSYPETGEFARPPLNQRPPWLPRISYSWRFLLALVLYILGWVVLTRWRMTRQERALSMAIACLVLVLLLAGSLAVEGWFDYNAKLHPLVVVADDGVLLRKGNGLSYARKYDTPLNRGVEARLLFTRGDWSLIELGHGETGWVLRSYILVDESGESASTG